MLRLLKLTHGDHDAAKRDVVDRVVAQVLSQIIDHANQMTTGELRGYVRARSFDLVRRNLNAHGPSAALSVNQRRSIESRLLERVVHEVLRALSVGPISTMPSPHVAVRNAA